jgi:hypothetical protein
MAELTGDTVRRMLSEVYGYEVTPADADTLARRARPMMDAARHLATLELAGIEQEFSFAVLLAEAERLKG